MASKTVVQPPAQPTVTSHREGWPSFVHETKTKRGRWISANYFSAEPRDYGEGWYDGEACAVEYMQWLSSRNGRCSGGFPDVVEGLADALRSPRDAAGYNSRGAAVGFSRAIEDILMVVSKDPTLMRYVEGRFKQWHHVHADRQRSAALRDNAFQRVLRRIERRAPKFKEASHG